MCVASGLCLISLCWALGKKPTWCESQLLSFFRCLYSEYIVLESLLENVPPPESQGWASVRSQQREAVAVLNGQVILLQTVTEVVTTESHSSGHLTVTTLWASETGWKSLLLRAKHSQGK